MSENVYHWNVHDLDPFGYLIKIMATISRKYDLDAGQVHTVCHYVLEDDEEVYEEFEFWDIRGVILNDKIYSRTTPKEMTA